MTKDEIRDMSRAVAQHFGLWTPGSICHYNSHGYACTHGIYLRDHEIPCPDLTEPIWFVRLLKATRMHLHPLPSGRWDGCRDGCWWADADTPEEALLFAAYQLAQRAASK